jgi:hypothetical protein
LFGAVESSRARIEPGLFIGSTNIKANRVKKNQKQQNVASITDNLIKDPTGKG